MTDYNDPDVLAAERREHAADAAWDAQSYACGACGRMVVTVDGVTTEDSGREHECIDDDEPDACECCGHDTLHCECLGPKANMTDETRLRVWLDSIGLAYDDLSGDELARARVEYDDAHADVADMINDIQQTNPRSTR